MGTAFLSLVIAGLALNTAALPERHVLASRADSVHLSAVTTDTGDFAPGRKTFTRYTPLMCIAAARNSAKVAQRSLRAQATMAALRNAPSKDTLPSDVVTIARTCGAQFTSAKVPARELDDLLSLALISHNDSLARAVVRQQLSLARNSKKGQALLSALQLVLSVRPVNEELAQVTLKTLDTTRTSTTLERMSGHNQLLSYYAISYDRSRIRQEANEVVRLGALPTGIDSSNRQAIYSILADAYRKLSEIAYLEGPDSVQALALRAQKTFSIFPKTTNAPWGSATAEQLRTELSPAGIAADTTGQFYPLLHADYWFPRTSEGTRGEHPLTMYVNTASINYGWWEEGCIRLVYAILNQCGDNSLPDVIRGYGKQYREHGLNIVVVARTGGHAMFSLPVSPAQEADSLRWYFLDYLELPAALAVVTAPVKQLPAPDGRLVFGDNDAINNYLPFSGLDQVILVNRQGKLIYKGVVGPFLDAFMARTMALLSPQQNEQSQAQ